MYEPARCIFLVFKRNSSIYVYYCRSEVQLQAVLTVHTISRKGTGQQHTTVSSPPGAARSSWSLNRPGHIGEKERVRCGLPSSPDLSVVQRTTQFDLNCNPRNRATFKWRTQEFCSGGGVQQIQLRTEDRENGDLGAVAPLVRGSGGSCNLVQEISFHLVKFS